jgi:predicted small secreted protein
MPPKIAQLLTMIGFAFACAACNTVEGIGKDVKATGQAIEKTADKAKPK